MLTLTCTDNADGSGLTCTASGADGGATVTFYAAASTFDSVGSSLPFASAGTRVGNGSLALSLAPSYYWITASALVGGVLQYASPIRGLASWASDSVYSTLLNAAVGIVQGLSLKSLNPPLPDISPANVKKLWSLGDKSADAKVTFPAVYVVPWGNVDNQGKTTGQDDIYYGFIAAIVDTRDESETAYMDTFSKWDEQIRRAIISTRITAKVNLVAMNWESRPAFDWGPAHDRYGRLICWNGFKFGVREPRGV